MKIVIKSYDSDGKLIETDTYRSEVAAISHCVHCSNMGWRFTVELVEDTQPSQPI